MMRVEAALSLRAWEPGDAAGKTVVVIDVLRAASVIALVLARGAAAVMPVRSLRRARLTARSLPRGSFLLGGERRGRRPPGFDCGNSPADYPSALVTGKTVILTTTNGTRAISLAREGATVIVAGLLNAGVVADYCARLGCDVLLLCAGQDGSMGIEDLLAAGIIARRLAIRGDVLLDDGARIASAVATEHAAHALTLLQLSDHGSFLAEFGFGDDIEACAMIDTVRVVPRLSQGMLVSSLD